MSIRKSSQSARLVWLISLPFWIILVVLEMFYTYERFNELDRGLIDRGAMVARQLAGSSEYGVYANNREFLSENAKKMLQEADVRSVLVLDATSQTLLMAGLRPGVLGPLSAGAVANVLSVQDTLHLLQVVNKESPWYDDGKTILLYQPILTPKMVQDTSDFDALPSVVPLGAVIVEMDRASIQSSKKRALSLLALLVLVCVLFALFVGLKNRIEKAQVRKRRQLKLKIFKAVKLTQTLNQDKESLRQKLDATMQALDQHAIVAATDVRGRIISVNDMFCRISGYSRAELLGQTHRMVNSGLHSKAFFRQMYRTIAQGNTWTGEVCNRAKNGNLYWVMTTITAFKGEEGKPIGYISVRTDITQRKENELELARYRSDLEGMVRQQTLDLQLVAMQADTANRSKQAFLANMSHEIRTPMNGVIGMLDVVLASTLSTAQQGMLNIASQSANALLIILNDILDFSNIEAGKLKVECTRTAVREVAEDGVRILSALAESKRVDLTLFVAPDVPQWIVTDPMRLRQVLLHLLDNAIKFTGGPHRDHGKVSLRIELEHLETGEMQILMRVIDNGIGMNEDEIAHLYKPFTQADESITRKYGGTGLCLSISQKLVELMGGRIRVSSQPGVGSEFVLEFPFREE